MSETDTHLQIISQVEAGLSAFEEANKELPDFSTPGGYAKAKKLRKPLQKARTTGDKARLAATKGLRDEVTRINTMWSESILPRISAMEDPLVAGIKAVDDEKARIEREKAEVEQSRIDEIEGRLSDIKQMQQAMTIETIDACVAELDGLDFEGVFQEFSESAVTESNNIRSILGSRRVDLVAQAEEAERLEAQRVEQEKQAAELQRQKDDAAEEQRQREAELKAKQDAIEAQKRELEDARRAEERRQAIAEAERKAQEKADREKLEALERAAKEKAEAEERARVKAIEDERKRVEAEAAEKERQRVAEQERVDAEQRKAERLAAMAPDADKLSVWLKSIPERPGMDTEEGTNTADKIDNLLQNISIFVDDFQQRSNSKAA